MPHRMMHAPRTSPLFERGADWYQPTWLQLAGGLVMVLGLAAAPLTILAMVVYYVYFGHNTP